MLKMFEISYFKIFVLLKFTFSIVSGSEWPPSFHKTSLKHIYIIKFIFSKTLQRTDGNSLTNNTGSF